MTYTKKKRSFDKVLKSLRLSGQEFYPCSLPILLLMLFQHKVWSFCVLCPFEVQRAFVQGVLDILLKCLEFWIEVVVFLGQTSYDVINYLNDRNAFLFVWSICKFKVI